MGESQTISIVADGVSHVVAPRKRAESSITRMPVGDLAVGVMNKCHCVGLVEISAETNNGAVIVDPARFLARVVRIRRVEQPNFPVCTCGLLRLKLEC